MTTPVFIAYVLVVLLWSTTPLGIVWSAETVDPTMAVLLRMLIATCLGVVTLVVFNISFPRNKVAIKLYCFSSIGVFGGMMLSYIAARYLPSGTLSLVFGLAPLISGLLSQKILNEAPFSKLRKFALLVAIVGLGIVCSEKLFVDIDSWPGIICILLAVTTFSLSGVLVKTVQIQINPIATTTGTLLISLPAFIAAWLITDGTLPFEKWSYRSIATIIYLGVLGSFFGFIAYYYILQKTTATSVSLITLMTPALAMTLGSLLNNEPITSNLIIGASAIMIGLGLYLFGEKITHRFRYIYQRTL
ncbi:MAG: DMT family transporter [Kangiellaceae bacterium]|jgi:drug/metabolite transporter (DMT)-like permease|nr:DMT family transporter [Kangiellaceae bacterium]